MVARTVTQYARAGVAALHIEDQVQTKRCGHLLGKQVVSREEFITRIRAAVIARDAIPADITSKQPDPASWGTPDAYFPNTQCDIMSHFLAQNLIFDITVCGDWAGAAGGA